MTSSFGMPGFDFYCLQAYVNTTIPDVPPLTEGRVQGAKHTSVGYASNTTVPVRHLFPADVG